MSYLSALNYKYKQEDSEETLFVFDTNYFLYAYQSYSNGDSYIKALENKKKDIYIPFITYIEFLSNLNNVTSLLKNDIKILENYIKSTVKEVKILDIPSIKQKLKSQSFKSNSKEYDQLNNLLKKDIEEIINTYVENSIKEVTDKYIEIETIINKNLKQFSDSEKDLPKIDEYEKKIENLTARIDELFKSTTILGEVYTQEEINEYLVDMDERYSKNIPPGFCDENKDGQIKVFGDLFIPAKAGDLILWKDVINIVQSDENRKAYTKVVIVTNDGISNTKSDWRTKLGKERVVNDQLKIEFYKKTNKLLDLMNVEDFIEYFSQEDEITKEHIVNEIKTFKEVDFSKEEKIKFTLFDKKYAINNQKEMMETVFIIVINMKGLRYKDLSELPCITTKDKDLNTIFDSYKELFLDEEKQVLLGTTLNKTDKLRYIYKLFRIAGFAVEELKFDSSDLQNIWEKFSQNKEKLNIDGIEISLERSENTLGISVISDLKFIKLGQLVENNLTLQIRDKLINYEFNDESDYTVESEFKNIMWNLGYDIENPYIDYSYY